MSQEPPVPPEDPRETRLTRWARARMAPETWERMMDAGRSANLTMQQSSVSLRK